MADQELKVKISAENTSAAALQKLLNDIKALIEQARILNALLNFRVNSSGGNGGQLSNELRQLEAEAQRLQQHLNLNVNAGNSNATLNSLGQSAHHASNNVMTLEQSAQLLHTRLNQFIALKIGEVVTGWGRDVIKTAEAYQTNSARLSLAITDHQEFIKVQGELFDITQRSRGSLDETTNAFVRNADSIKRMGGTTEQALQATELLNKAIASTSQGTSQDAAALLQWNQALGKGILNGDELNSIMENSLGLTKAIADGMGVPIGKLKELGEQGKLTGTDLINALFNQRDAIDKTFNTIPMTVSQSITAVENAFQKYVGEANSSSHATQNLASAISGFAKNLPEIIDAGVTLAELYGVKLAQSVASYIAKLQLQKSAEAEAAAEAERLNFVRIQQLEIDVQVARASVTAARADMERARLDMALARTTAERALANEALAASVSAVTAAEERYTAATATLTAATTTATESMTVMQTVAKGLSTAFSALFAAWIGWEVGAFLRKFESVRMAGSYLTETMVVSGEVLAHFFTGDFITGEQGLLEKIKQVHQTFADGRAADSDAAIAAQEGEKARTDERIKLAEQEKIAKQEAFKETVKKYEDAGKEIDAETARQTDATKIALEQRKADIENSTQSRLQKELLVTQAVRSSDDAQLLILQQSAGKKLQLLDAVYQAELAKLKDGTVEKLGVEQQSLTARLGIYQGFEKSYTGMINSLIADEQRLAGQAQQLAEQRKGIEQSYEDFKRQLHQLELTDTQKTSEDVARLRKLSSDRDRALKQGDFDKASELDLKILDMGKSLALSEKQKAEEAKKSHKVYFDNTDEIVRLTDKAQANILKTNQTAQNVTQQRLEDTRASAETVKQNLQGVQNVIANISNELAAKNFTLSITSNTSDVDAAIARISKPTESTHTIRVVEDHVQAHSTGGYIVPSHYATGGNVDFKKREGSITGKGTGTSDEIPAMLSNGEYVIKADKVAQYGKSTFDAINYGTQPVAIAHFSSGGIAGNDLAKKEQELRKAAYEQFVKTVEDPRNYITWQMDGTTSGIADPNSQRERLAYHIGQYLRTNNLPAEWRDIYMQSESARINANIALNTHKSFREQAAALLKLEKITEGVTGEQPNIVIPPELTSTLPKSVSAPALNIQAPTVTPLTIPPPNYTPLTTQQTSVSSKISTVKFEAANGKTTVGHSSDPEFAKFFDDLKTVSGVTQI